MRDRLSALVAACALAVCTGASGCQAARENPGNTAHPDRASATVTEVPVERLCPDADLDTRRVLDCLNSDISSFWAAAGRQAPVQRFVYYALPSSVSSPDCARLLALRSWFRCVTDDVVYLSGQLVERDRDLFRVDIGLDMAFIVSESFGLALQGVQGQPGIDVPDPADSRRVTLSADCLAGVWAAAAQVQDRLSVETLRSVIEEELTASYLVPVPPALAGFLPEAAYGSVADRLSAFDRGSATGETDACEQGLE